MPKPQLSIKTDTRLLDEILQKCAGANVPTWVISDGVEYGVYQELGTSRFGARPFLFPAFEDKTKDLPDAVGQAVERGMDLGEVFAKTAFDIQSESQRNIQTKKIIDTGALLNSMHTSTE
jgi:hypothetical protein